VKAVIPAAGLGTRFLPVTKAQPKEMLPVVDKPAIQYVVEEAVASGNVEILIITGRGKRAIEDHFDKNIELEDYLHNRNKKESLEEMKRIWAMAEIFYVRQKEPLGLGDAVGRSERYIGKEPFAVLLGDDIIVSDVPCLKQLIGVFGEFKSSVIAIERVPKEKIEQYAMVVGEKVQEGLFKVEDIIEKPPAEDVVSDMGTVGRYVFTPTIFNHIKKTKPGYGGEIQLTDAIRSLLSEEEVYALEFKGKRYDVGDKLGWLMATIELAMKREEFREGLSEFLTQMTSS
jgi:UTP--glucose-1-phosphate uridylyltransferase